MKIAMVLPGGAGGGARMVVRFAAGLIERGHEVSLLHPAGRTSLRDALREAYLKVWYGARHDWLRGFAGRVQPFSMLRPELVGCNDVLIGNGVDCVLAMADLPPECGIKVHHSHGREPWILNRMLRAWALPMPRIITTSHLLQEMRERGSTDEIYIVRYGIDRSEYYPALPASERKGVGTTYHGGPVKDPETILAVLGRVHQASPQTPLYMFGTFPCPKGLPPVTRYVRLPSLAVARELYSRSLVWFCASRSEGFALPPLEAMACGCAAVSTDCGGPSDFIESGVNGFLVPVGDADALVERILQLLRDAVLRERFVAASQAVVNRLTWPAAIGAYESALESIVARAARTRQAEPRGISAPG